MVDGWSKCDCCSTILPDGFLQKQTIKQYEDSNEQTCTACIFCALIFPPPLTRPAHERSFAGYNMALNNEYALLMGQAEAAEKQRKRLAIRRSWASFLEAYSP